MNKPVKLLASVSVLLFASMGLYYAWLAPRKTGTNEPTPPRQAQTGARVSSGGSVAPSSDVARTVPANSVPSQVPVDRAVPIAPNTPPGFKPVEQAMQPLPDRLPGFEPAKAVPVQGVAAAPAPSAPASNANPAAQPVPAASSRTVAAAATPAPAANQPAAVSAPQSPAATAPSVAGATASVTPGAKAVPAPVAPPAAAKPAPKPSTYTVKAGDSLSSIWRGITGSERGWEKLQAANPGVDSSRLKIGQVLKVPELEAATAASGSAPRAPAAAATTTLPASGKSDAAAVTGGTAGGTYTVASGDTLSSISTKVLGSGKHWKQIYEANKDVIGTDPANLKVGQVLRIPAKGGAARTAAPKTAAGATESRPAPSQVPPAGAAPAPRAPAPPGTIGAPAPAPSVSPAGTPAPR